VVLFTDKLFYLFGNVFLLPVSVDTVLCQPKVVFTIWKLFIPVNALFCFHFSYLIFLSVLYGLNFFANEENSDFSCLFKLTNRLNMFKNSFSVVIEH